MKYGPREPLLASGERFATLRSMPTRIGSVIGMAAMCSCMFMCTVLVSDDDVNLFVQQVFVVHCIYVQHVFGSTLVYSVCLYNGVSYLYNGALCLHKGVLCFCL